MVCQMDLDVGWGEGWVGGDGACIAAVCFADDVDLDLDFGRHLGVGCVSRWRSGLSVGDAAQDSSEEVGL